MAQPPPSRLSLRALLSLPYRLCNPPPSVGKVRSCSLTPVPDVRLDDVLARRHLPPIGLKDLEEYLLYVERTPENLYFVLWLKEYAARYHTWVQRHKSSLVPKKDHKFSRSRPQKFAVPPIPDPALAMFYLRAKQTFFTPNSEYELNIPSDILAPFHSSSHNHALYAHPHDLPSPSPWHSQSVHPDPAVFAEVAIETRFMLNESLRRFVRVAYTNVGSQRALCGIIAGCIFTIVAGLVPLIITTVQDTGRHRRLIRLVAVPGLWFGLTILIASLQGICLMVYVFGDLRQLRKFELARPTISRPLPSPLTARPRGASFPEKNIEVASHTFTSFDSPNSFVSPSRTCARFSAQSLAGTTSGSCESEACSSVECNEIDISPAFFDDVPAPEGPATASCLHRPEYLHPAPSVTYVEPAHVRPEGRSPTTPAPLPTLASPVTVEPTQSTRSVRSAMKISAEFGPTAGFIPNDYSNSTASLCDTTRSLRSQRSACYFSFDLLPSNPVGQRHRGDSTSGGDHPSSPAVGVNPNLPLPSSVVADAPNPHPSVPAPSSSTSLGGAVPFLGRAQYKCNQHTSPAFTSSASEKGSFSIPSKRHALKKFTLTTLIPSFTAGVPAFATPLTQIQSPVVKRAQWEVVVRAALVAAVITGTLSAIIVAAVP